MRDRFRRIYYDIADKNPYDKDEIAKDVLKNLGFKLDGKNLIKNNKVVGTYDGFDPEGFPMIKLNKALSRSKIELDKVDKKPLGAVRIQGIMLPNGNTETKFGIIHNFGGYIEGV